MASDVRTPKEVLIREVHFPGKPTDAVELQLHGLPLRRIPYSECFLEPQESLRILRRGGRLNVSKRDGLPIEILQVLAQGVEVELSVLARAVVLLVPVVREDATVHVVKLCPPALDWFQKVLQLVEPAFGSLHTGDEVPRVVVHCPDRRPLVRREHPGGRVLGDRFPDLLRRSGQLGIDDDLEFTVVVSHCSAPWLNLGFSMV